MILTTVEIISACPHPIIGVDDEGVISVFNHAAEKLLGFKAQDVIGSLNISEVYEQEGEADDVKQVLETASYGAIGQIAGYKTRIVGKDGQVLPVRLSATTIKAADGKDDQAIGVIHYFQDLTAIAGLEHQLRELSRTDHLTQMYNSKQLYQSLHEEILRSTRYKHPFGLICFSLDGLRETNEQLGHLIGDEVLKLLALVTRDTLRENDTGYRYTGNEFLLICPETDYSGAALIAERLQNNLSNLLPQALNKSFDELNKPLTLNQGITVFYGGNAVSTNELIRQAVQTMEKAKQDTHSQICLFQATSG